MFRRSAALVGALALLLIAAQPARAQYRGGFYGGGYPFGAGYYPGYYYGYNGFYSNGFSMYGPPVPTYGSVPGTFGGADQRLGNYAMPARPRHYHHSAPMQPLPAELERQVTELPAAEAAAASATLEVRVPVSSAEVLIDGERTSQTGNLRTFRSPPLEPGKQYQYRIEARWLENGQPLSRTETVTVETGKMIQIDLRPTETAADGQFLPSR